MKPNLLSAMAYIGGRYYKVEPYPLDPYQTILVEKPDLKAGIAYRYETDLTKGLFPYRGEIDETFDPKTAEVGIYLKRRSHDRYQVIIVRPHNQRQKTEHHIGTEKSLAVAVLEGDYTADNFIDPKLMPADIGKTAYFPPIRTDDDFLNKLIKLGIRLKAAPLEPYGQRMAALAVDQRRSVEGNNLKNNTKRRHMENSAMSPSKATQDADTWQMDIVVGLRNRPGAMHKLLGVPDDAVLLLYPNSQPFDLKEATLINAEDLLTQAIAETSEGIEAGEPILDNDTNETTEPED